MGKCQRFLYVFYHNKKKTKVIPIAPYCNTLQKTRQVLVSNIGQIPLKKSRWVSETWRTEHRLRNDKGVLSGEASVV